ncbi:MAG TPA: MoaD/ThiS family protein [Blastocatellia bacterium]|nr:MoaD/ThiS family protein [Blastocatellia bacterium]
MLVRFQIPGPLRQFTGGSNQVQIETSGSSLLEVLTDLWAAYPGIRDRVMTEQGRIREHVSIFVGTENIRDIGGLAARVPAGGEISIVPAVSGGRA